MGKECFTCSHKKGRELTKEEKDALQRKHREEHGRPSLFILDMEFKCGVSGLTIHQTDPACPDYSGDKTMESIRRDIAKTAGRLRQELMDREEGY